MLRVALGGVFLWAAWVKLDNPQAFADSIKGFKLLPPAGDHLVVLATFAVPWVEALAGAVLVLGLWSRAASLVLLLNLAAFIAAIVSVLERGISTKCGCFGKFSPFCPETITTCNIIQNSVLAAVAGLILLRGGGLLGIDRGSKPKPPAQPPAPSGSILIPIPAPKPSKGAQPPAPGASVAPTPKPVPPEPASGAFRAAASRPTAPGGRAAYAAPPRPPGPPPRPAPPPGPAGPPPGPANRPK